VGATSQPLGFPAPLARLSSSTVTLDCALSPSCYRATAAFRLKTFQRDRPCTQAVYPRLLRDSSLVQTAFAPSPASKDRSASYS